MHRLGRACKSQDFRPPGLCSSPAAGARDRRLARREECSWNGPRRPKGDADGMDKWVVLDWAHFSETKKKRFGKTRDNVGGGKNQKVQSRRCERQGFGKAKKRREKMTCGLLLCVEAAETSLPSRSSAIHPQSREQEKRKKKKKFQQKFKASIPFFVSPGAVTRTLLS